MTNLVLHLGVHKTGTTHFQSRCQNSRERLIQHGVGYLDLAYTRKHITSQLNDHFSLGDDLRSYFDSCSTVLISDENITGSIGKPSDRTLYKSPGFRVHNLVSSYPFHEVSLHLTIRNPEKYLVSRYFEYLRHFKFMPIQEYYDEIFLRDFSWTPLVKCIEEYVGLKANVTSFEDIFTHEDQYIKKLLGLDVELNPASNEEEVRRSKLSLETYEILLQAAKHYEPAIVKRLVNLFTNNRQFSTETQMKPFSKSLSDQLTKNYEKDKQALGLV